MTMYKIWVRHESAHDAEPYTFPVTEEAASAADAMAVVRGKLARAYVESYTDGVADCPAHFTWWPDGCEDQAERNVIAAVTERSAAMPA